MGIWASPSYPLCSLGDSAWSLSVPRNDSCSIRMKSHATGDRVKLWGPGFALYFLLLSPGC